MRRAKGYHRYHSFMHHQSTMNKSQKNTYQSTQSSSIIKQVYIYIVLTPLLDHSNYIPWLMTIRVKMAPENPMVPPKLIQQTVGFTSIYLRSLKSLNPITLKKMQTCLLLLYIH